MVQRHLASEEFVVWAQSLSGMLTMFRTSYGSIEEMLEHSDWDEGKTEYLLQLVQGLHSDLKKLDKEISDHVKTKNRKKL
jgi:transcription termination factor NusB